jgi:hypothetical protein
MRGIRVIVLGWVLVATVSVCAEDAAIAKKDYRAALLAANQARRPVARTASVIARKVVERNNARAEEVVKRVKALMAPGAR